MAERKKPMTVHTIAALKAVWAGEANPGQQRHALEWIINEACEYGRLSFRSDKDGGERDTAFAQGKWHVGQQILKLIGLKGLFEQLREHEDAGHTTREPNDKHAKSGS